MRARKPKPLPHRRAKYTSGRSKRSVTSLHRDYQVKRAWVEALEKNLEGTLTQEDSRPGGAGLPRGGGHLGCSRSGGRQIDPERVRRVLGLRQVTRTVRKHGQKTPLYNFGLYVDRLLRGQRMEVLICDQVLRVEYDDQWVVSYPCTYDTKRRRITSVNPEGRQQYRHFRAMQ